MSTPELYTVQQVADHLGLHPRTVRRYVREGTLPARRVGRQYRVSAADLEAFTAAQATQRPAAPPAPVAEVSATVRVAPFDRRAADRLGTLLLGAAQPSGQDRRPLHVSTSYDPAQRVLRVVVVGDPDDAAALLRLVSAITEDLA